MRLSSLGLELKILRTLTNGNSKRTAQIYASLSPECFYSDLGQEIYNRVITLAKERVIMVSWESLLNDPVLKEATRARLQKYKRAPITGRNDLADQLQLLHNYRRARAIYFASEYAIDHLKRENVDVDRLEQQVNEKLSGAVASTNTASWFTHIGGDDDEAKKFIKELLSDKIKQIYIPTGIRAFDRVNIGIPRTSFWMIAAETGGGKSALANQICGNMAEAGAKVCIVQLEMSRIETGQRHMARKGQVAMERAINPTRISRVNKRRIDRRWMAWHKRIKTRRGLLTIFAPEEDLTIEQIFLLLKPFKYDVIMIDYIGLLKGVDEQDYPRLLGRVARLGKRHAINTNTVVAACAQLSAEGIVRYSRAMQEHAQNLWIWKYGDEERNSKVIRVRQPKSRNQVGMDFFLQEDFRRMRFRGISNKRADKLRNQQRDNKRRRPEKSGQRRFDRKRSERVLSDNDFSDLADQA